MRTLSTSLFRIIILVAALLPVSFQIGAQTSISGRVVDRDGNAMPGVVVTISGTVDTYVFTDSTGNYSANLPTGGNYTIAPYSNANPLNGVSTFDVVMISRHVDGIQPIVSPYDLIAADVNKDDQVTLADTVDLRHLILWQIQEFPNNTSWRFVRADYVFPDSTNPFDPPFPETYINPNLTANVADIDFIGIKIGDINRSSFLGLLTDSTALSWIDGTVRIDDNSNCLADPNETPLRNWLAVAEGLYGTYYGKTNGLGVFTIAAPPGTYDVTLFPPNSLWNPCVQTQQGVTTNLLARTAIEYAVQAVADCPAMEVDLSAPFLRRCFVSNYTVRYCNQGTIVAADASVEVNFDPFLEVQSSSIPWSSVNGNTYTFDLGDIQPGNCSSFRVQVLTSCDAELGQTHCSSASIYPDTLCVPPNPAWSGANLEVDGKCDNGEVVFTIKNTGDGMTQASDYVVIEDIMIQMSSGAVQLGAGQTETVTIPANGSTWRLEVDQVPFHPWSTLPSAAIEGCGENGNGGFSMGFITQFPFGDEQSTYDRDCQENIGSFDPNDKQGFPRGIEAEHYIPKGQEISYKIRFQNTGTDTAFNIIILDTLSERLDLSTFRAGSSSHPYTYNVLGEGIVQFIFQDILLPDSNINEPLSHGFVQFRISPRGGLPNNTVVENSAAIYFDFNEPVLTNTTWHTIGEQYLNVSTVLFQPGVDIDVFPNPFVQSATFYLKSPSSLAGRLQLLDLQGRRVQEQQFQSNVFDLNAQQLPPGIYIFRLELENGQLLATGKLVKAN